MGGFCSSFCYFTRKFDKLPLSGLDDIYEVIPNTYKYFPNKETTLSIRGVMKESMIVSYEIQDLEGWEWFSIETVTSKADETTIHCVMKDFAGEYVASIKIDENEKVAEIFYDIREDTVVHLATVTNDKNIQSTIILYQLHCHEDMSVNKQAQLDEDLEILIRGDFYNNFYHFISKMQINKPVKVAQVTSKYKEMKEPCTFFLTVGANVDMALIVLSSVATYNFFHATNSKCEELSSVYL